MRTAEAPHGTVVVGVDGSSHSMRAADWAAAAASYERRALTLVHSADPFAFEEGGVWSGWGDWYELQRRAKAEYGLAISNERTRLGEAYPDLEIHVVEDYVDPRLALVQLSEHARFVVLGSHGRGRVASALLGSVSAAVARRASCPVVVLRPARAADVVPDGVAVVIDDAHPSTATAELAFGYAQMTSRPLRVVLGRDDREHDEDVSDEDLRREVSELCAGLREDFPDVVASFDVERGPLEDVIVGATMTAELTVMSRRPHRGLTKLAMSSLTTTVLEHALGPVVVNPVAGR